MGLGNTMCPCASLAYCSPQHLQNRARLVLCAQLRCFELVGLCWGKLETFYSFVMEET